MLDSLAGRNGSREFARRSMRNLDFILTEAKRADVHPVTQTVSTLLAIIVFPWEKRAYNSLKNKRLPLAVREGWPVFEMSGSCVDANAIKTVGHLIKRLRDAVAHGHVRFDSDSQDPTQVIVTFESRKAEDWRGEIRADRLASFCRIYSNYIEEQTG